MQKPRSGPYIYIYITHTQYNPDQTIQLRWFRNCSLLTVHRGAMKAEFYEQQSKGKDFVVARPFK